MELTRITPSKPGSKRCHYHAKFTAEDFPRAVFVSQRLAAMGYGLDGEEGVGAFALAEYSGSSSNLLLAEAALASQQHMTSFFNTFEADFSVEKSWSLQNEERLALITAIGARFGFAEKSWLDFVLSFSLLTAFSKDEQGAECFYYAAYLFQVLSGEEDKHTYFFTTLLQQHYFLYGRLSYLSPGQVLLAQRAFGQYDNAEPSLSFGYLFAELLERFSSAELEVLVNANYDELHLNYLLDIANTILPGEGLQAVLDAAGSMPEEVLRALLYGTP